MTSNHVFNIQGHKPAKDGKGYGCHVRAIVVCETVEQAIDLIKHEHEGVTIHNVQHHGVVDIIAVRSDSVKELS